MTPEDGAGTRQSLRAVLHVPAKWQPAPFADTEDVNLGSPGSSLLLTRSTANPLLQPLQLHWWTWARAPYLLNEPFSVQFSRSVVSRSLWPCGLQHARLPCSSPTPQVCSNSCPSSQWCHPAIPSSFIPFSSCLQSFPASGSFPMSQFFTSGGQSIGVSASASVLLINIQDWFPLRLTGLTSLQSKGLSRVFPNTTIWKHQFFGTQPSLWPNSHIHTWLLEKP